MRAHEHPGKDTDPGRQRPHAQPVPAGPVDELLALQRTAGNAATARLVEEAGDTSVHQVLRSAGRPLEEPVRQEMEARLGADFSGVRVHDDTAARTSAEEVGARAYTSGDHVVLGAGGADKHTLAHELTHVLQQRSGPVSGTDTGAGLSISDPTDQFEREAEANATRVMTSEPVQRVPTTAPRSPTRPAGMMIQRLTNATPAANFTDIVEGDVQTVGPGEQIRYPSLNSCMTVTVHLRSGGMVGGHMVIMHVAAQRGSDQVMREVRQRIGNQPVAAIELVGDFLSWNSAWLETSVPQMQADAEASGVALTEAEVSAEPNARATIRAAAQRILGHGVDKYETEQFTGNWYVDSRPRSRRTGLRGYLPTWLGG